MSTTEGRRPLASTRRTHILAALQQTGTVRISELVDELGVSAITLRRDVEQLASEGLLDRVHGGAISRPDTRSSLTDTRTSLADFTDDRDTAAPDGNDGRQNEALPGAANNDRQPPRPGGRTTTALGMLVPSLAYYWPGVVRGAEEQAAVHGAHLVLRGSSYANYDESPQLDHLLAQPDVQGLLVAPTLGGPGAAATTEWLTHSPVPVVLLERTAARGPHGEAFESVMSDHQLGAAVAVRYLASLGHHRIAVAGTHSSPTTPNVRAGWHTGCDDLGLPHTDDLAFLMPPVDAADWDTAAEDLVQRVQHDGITAVLVHSDPEAIAFVQRCQAHGISVPEELSVISYDDEVAGLFRPALTAVRPPRRSIGRAAVDLLMARLIDPGRAVHRVLVSPTLEVRGSTAPPPRATGR